MYSCKPAARGPVLACIHCKNELQEKLVAWTLSWTSTDESSQHPELRLDPMQLIIK